MKSLIACAIIAISAIQLVRGDGYDAPTQTYTYDYSSGYDGSNQVATGVCGGIVANLGILGCTKYMQDYLDKGSDLDCYSACNSYVVSLVATLKAQGTINTKVDGTVSLVAGLGGASGYGNVLTGLVASVSVQAVVGAVIGGSFGGVSGSLDDVINQLNALIRLAGSVSFARTCVSTKCFGSIAPTYA